MSNTKIGLGTVSLIIGGVIYLLFRPSSLAMFTWLDYLQLRAPIDTLRQASREYSNHMPAWLIYAAPNGLWMLSFSLYMSSIWRGNSFSAGILWTALLTAIAISSELLQMTGIISGKFDILDVVAYITGASLPYIATALPGGKNESK